MAVFNNIFNGKKEEPLSPAEVRALTLQKLGETRKMASEIYKELDAVNHSFNMYRQKANIKQAQIITMVDGQKMTLSGVEIINDIEPKVRGLLNHLCQEVSADLVAIQTERIDAKLLYFAQQLKVSLDKADLYSAQACVVGLLCGIIQGHRSIPSTYEPKMVESELRTRERKIEDYKAIVDVGMEMNRLETVKNALKQKYNNEVMPRYDEAHEEFLADKADRAHIYREIAHKSGEELDAEHLTAWRLTARDNNLFRACKSMAIQISGLEDNIARYQVTVLQLQNAAILEGVQFNAELQMKIDKIMATIPDTMASILATTNEQQKSLDSMFNEFDAVLNDPDVRVGMAKTMQKSQSIAKKLEDKERKENEDADERLRELEAEAEKLMKDQQLKEEREKAMKEAMDKIKEQPLEVAKEKPKKVIKRKG